MIRSVYHRETGEHLFDLGMEELAAAAQDETGLLWVDFTAEPPQTARPILQDAFGFHPLAMDDALVESHVSKIDDWDRYLYIVLHAVGFGNGEDGRRILSVELDLFLGSNYLVTYHNQPIAAVERVWNLGQRDPRIFNRGSTQLLYRLADEMVADHMPLVEQLDEAVDEIEDQVLGDPGRSVLEEIFSLKRSVAYLRRTMGPQRETFHRLSRGDYAIVPAGQQIYFRDVYDHLVRLYDITESLRDLASGALDTYLSAVSNRMNNVMRILTLITTLFMPVSFLAAFFGMNFFQPAIPLDVWTGRTAFALVLLVMAASPVCLAIWMRRRGWL